MASASALLNGAAAAIWEEAGGKGPPPDAAFRAASDLFELYESLNGGEPVEDLVERFPGVVSGEDLAWFAIAHGEPAVQAIYVPTFEVRRDGADLVWEGGERHVRNPSSIPVVLLIEDDPKLQATTSRMIKKVLPDSHVVVADNADAAIADLKNHENVVVIVSDYDILGDKTGLDVFRWVQANRPDLVGRYLFFSGNTDVEGQGAAVLMKPAGLADFKSAVLSLGRTAPTRRPTTPPRTVALPRVETVRPLSTQGVADAVLAVMPSIGHEGPHGQAKGRFGDRKVFIAAIWRRLSTDPRFRGMSLEQFKRHLLEAQRTSMLVLSRADLRGAMDSDEVQESEIDDRGSTYNFVNDPNADRQKSYAQSAVPTSTVAREVLRVMPRIHEEHGPDGRPRGRFGGGEVFIAALWRQLERNPEFRGISVDQFKAALIDANRQGLLLLSRADLTGAMDPTEFRESEIRDRGATFHFVADPNWKW
jgi:CheY-like chemotaxis protein